MIKHTILAAFVALSTFACTAPSTDEGEQTQEESKPAEENVRTVTSEMRMVDFPPKKPGCTWTCTVENGIQVCRGNGPACN